MRTLNGLLLLLLLTAPAVARADLPGCDHKDLALRMFSHFNDAQQTRNAPQRARKLETMVETGMEPTGGYAPKDFKTRYCEGDLRLDDNSTLHVFIYAVGVPNDGKSGAEAIDTCWLDPRFPRFAPGCSRETAPSRRK